ncbi:hypothetical protein GCM10010109_66340 [Actinoplanes campanulatus]|nr:hypothetical protein GCM10010109_66340 [Actinoplanes campanulatus]GID40275.1 hypothetical protein Aca09nite_67810 [Actinoplanes campanulatus]
MAAVWQATDRWLGRKVAVKVLHERVLDDPTVAGRFEREARMVAGLAHPNIVALHDVGVDGGIPYLVMELVPGRSLAALLSTGPLDIAAAVGIAAQVCAALEAASEAGIVHRDIKPANILITDDGRAKVCDFGIARAAGATRSELTGSAQMLGTSTYMAPEQVVGGAVDVRTDLYGLGCVLYAMLTGNPPFTGDSPMRIAWDHVERVPVPASTHRPVPDELDLLLQSMLAKYPADRPSDPATVRAALEKLSPDPKMADREVPGRSGRDRRGLLLTGLGTVVGAGVLAMIAATGDGSPGPQTAPARSGPPSTAATSPPAATPDGVAAPEETAPAGVAGFDEKAARDLIKKLEKENGGKTTRGNSEARRRLNELRRAGKLNESAYRAVLAELDPPAM